MPPQLDAIRTIVRTQIDPIVDALTEQMLDAALQAGIKAAAEIVSSVPIVGALVKVLWSFGSLAARAVREARDYGVYNPLDNPKAPRGVDPQVDRYLYEQYILGPVAAARDTTSIWLPPSDGLVGDAVTANREPFFAVYLSSDTWRVENTNHREGWLGCVPGTAARHEAFEGVTDTGAGLPTVQSQGATLWGTITSNGPTQYTVRGPDVVRYWQDYLLSLRRWLQRQHLGTGRLPKQLAAGIITHYSDRGPLPYHFWRVPEHGPDGPWGIQAATPVQTARWVTRAQRANLSTPTCAYVDDTFAALADDAVLRSVWDTKRRELLHHPDRALIDLQNIPDPEYRAAMAQAQDGAPNPTGGPVFSVGEAESAPPAPWSLGGGSGGAVAALAAAVVAYLGWRLR